MALLGGLPVDVLRMRLISLILFTATLAHADPRADLDSVLASFTGREPIQVSIVLEVSNQSGDTKKPTLETGSTTARIQDAPDGLNIFWDRQQLDAVVREKSDQTNDEDGGPSTQRAMNALSVSQVAFYLNAAPTLIEVLDGATLTGDKAADRNETPARQLSFKLDPKLSEKNRKYIKEFEATAQVWLGSDGVPIAAERNVFVKGRAMLVIGFESMETETYAFARVGDRLVVTHHTKDSRGSGGGESSQRNSVARLTVGSPAG